MITTEKLIFGYSSNRLIHFRDLSIAHGESCLLLGESGSGKTTLLHLLGGLLRRYTGNMNVDGQNLNALSESALDKFRGKHIGFIFQKNHLIQALTVEKNLFLPSYLAGVAIRKEYVNELLEILGISQIRKSKVNQLSEGQAQRVAIARSIINKPSVILADEPTSALDDKNCAQVITLLLEVAKANNATLIVATHDQRLKQNISRHILLKQEITIKQTVL